MADGHLGGLPCPHLAQAVEEHGAGQGVAGLASVQPDWTRRATLVEVAMGSAIVPRARPSIDQGAAAGLGTGVESPSAL
jgi:hypothetical protein